jgi:hypothetical protein
MRWAYQQAPIPVGQNGKKNPVLHQVLAALAFHADGDTGRNCWCSVDRLVLETGLAERTVRAALKALEVAALIVRVGVGPSGTVNWTLDMSLRRAEPMEQALAVAAARRREADRVRQERKRKSDTVTASPAVTVTAGLAVTGNVTAPVAVMSRQEVPDVTAPGAPDLPITYPTTKKTSSSASTVRVVEDVANDFAQFWAAYPKRGGKPMVKDDARKAWASVIKAAGKPDADGKTWTVDQIIAGARRYARECESIRDRTYVKTPGPWLRAGMWKYEDGVEASGGDPRGFLVDCWKRGAVNEIHKFFTSGYVQPPAGDGDYVEDVLVPYNRRWITEHKDQILARLTTSEAS